jgi:carbonyl reductase 1
MRTLKTWATLFYIPLLLWNLSFLPISSLSTDSMRIAVVTGANKGIGKAIASNLATCGNFSHVILGCRNDALAKTAVEEIASEPNACHVSSYPLVIGDDESHKSFRAAIEEQFGKVDVLVNNAGMAFKNADPTPFEEQCTPTLNVNFRGTVHFTEELLPLLRKGDDARIVNVASMAGHLSQIHSRELREKFSNPELSKTELFQLVDNFEADVHKGQHLQNGWGNSNYGLSKLALIAMTKVWAREEAKHGIAVNCCCPGYCDTDMTSHRGPRSPKDGAKNAVIPATMESPPTGEFFADYQVSTW